MKPEVQTGLLKTEIQTGEPEKTARFYHWAALRLVFPEHLDYLLLKQIDPVKRANFFGLVFDQ